MLNNWQIRVVIAIILAVWAAIAWIQGQPFPQHLATSFSYSVTVTTSALLLWDRWLWRWPGLRALASRPDLRGTWRGELRSDWSSPETHHREGPIEAYLVIRQTYSAVDVRMFSLESSSTSLSANIVTDAAGVHRLFVTYQNEPRALLRDRSPMHYGGALLTVRGDPVETLDGEYWTDRRTRGEAVFQARVEEVTHDFPSAAGRFK